jgi:MFS family permease
MHNPIIVVRSLTNPFSASHFICYSIAIAFLFHTSNGTVLPLVMQTLAIGSGRTGILMSGLCIIVAQIFMVASAKICGDYSGRYGRKPLFLIGLFVVPIRCFILTGLLMVRGDGIGSPFMQFLILSTQVLDGVGAGVFGTMYILVTSDISGGTGRFSMTLGLTTAAMSIGGTVSGYLGEALAQDIGYMEAFFILGIMSLVPAVVYLIIMPETLPDLANKTPLHELGSIQSIKEGIDEDGEKPYVELT